MDLKSVTYTSLARLDLTERDLGEIHKIAQDLNALEGITGMLIFDGSKFLQIIEGAETAIDDLLGRIRLDPRHSAVEIRDERIIPERSFPDWAMELVCVESRYYRAREQILDVLPATVPTEVRNRILEMAKCLSGPVRLPD